MEEKRLEIEEKKTVHEKQQIEEEEKQRAYEKE